MKTAISIPDPVFHAAEEAAQRLSLSRSQLYTEAVREFLAAHAPEDVTERLNAVYAETASELDPLIAEMQQQTLKDDAW
jgi:metal-responsive CopG/Arc/MetJ family transcriptional regulator